jgi:hypothetical protein
MGFLVIKEQREKAVAMLSFRIGVRLFGEKRHRPFRYAHGIPVCLLRSELLDPFFSIDSGILASHGLEPFDAFFSGLDQFVQ